MPVEPSSSATITFLVYTLGVFIVAIFSHRLLKKKSFLSEYFLGSRGLGLWALAMSYAATSSSGGSFTGFPALIYKHGWILALWIASYMIVPVFVMGLFGKRINQVARKTGAITVPDVLRDRFSSPKLGLVASALLVIFLIFNLVAQFKAGAIIVENLLSHLEIYKETASLLDWIPATFSVLSNTKSEYCLALLMFAVAVVSYTVYGGFRAVVWTDVLQGIVMLFGVMILLFLTLSKTEGGLAGATERLASLRQVRVRVEVDALTKVEAGSKIVIRKGDKSWEFSRHGGVEISPGEPQFFGVERYDAELKMSDLAAPTELRWLMSGEPESGIVPVRSISLAYDESQHFLGGPGFKDSASSGFLPLSMAFSFFMMWVFAGAGQPTTMVRLMAFRDTRVYRRAMFSVSIYYSLIYIPLILTFICARSVIPDLDRPDHAMARLVITVAPGALAGILLAAPFAAIMSTVDSFLLAISSSLVRDIYQRSWNPDASEKTIRRLSYLTTAVVGAIVMFGAFNPPEFLQSIIVLTGAGTACTFLFPMIFSLYWKRMTARGTMSGMLLGFGTCGVLYGMGWLGFFGGKSVLEPTPGGVLPLLWGLLASITGCIAGSYLDRRPSQESVDKFFAAE